ncbi:hypothetical protein ACFL0W_05185 [Nanoarchaeota archaeon]
MHPKKHSKPRKAQIQMQFNWVFVAIIGAIIIIFFMSIVQKQKASSDITLSHGILSQIDAVATGAGVSIGTSNELEMPNMDFIFQCDSGSCSGYGCPSTYSVENFPGVSNSYETDTIFSPSKISGNNLITWSQDFSIPFRVTNFLYLTGDQMKYYIVHSGPDTPAKSLNASLPKHMNKEIVKASDVSTLLNKNNYKVRFIYINGGTPTVPTELEDMPDEDVTALTIASSGTDNVWDVTFYKKSTSSFISSDPYGLSHALTNASLFGAIFSDSRDIYECNMKKAFARARLVSSVYHNRTEELSLSPYLTTRCRDLAILVYPLFEGISIELDTSFTYEGDFDTDPQKTTITNTGSAMENIKEANYQALIRSCPVFY